MGGGEASSVVLARGALPLVARVPGRCPFVSGQSRSTSAVGPLGCR